MACQTLLSARQHLTAADFYDGEFRSCFHVYSQPYSYPCGNYVVCIIRIRGLCGPCELCPERDLAREVLEQAFAVLTASWMRFDIGFNGGFIWDQYMEEVQEGAYDEWRVSAWTMFNEIPDLLRQSGYDLQTMGVEPLQGPWKWKFL